MHRRITAAVALAAVVAVAGAGAALGYPRLTPATLTLVGDYRGRPGTALTARGDGFAPPSTGAGPVVLHWATRTGPELATGLPGEDGKVDLGFTVPESASGYYTIFGVQADAAGADVYGTPARAAVGVPGPPTTPPPSTLPPPPGAPPVVEVEVTAPPVVVTVTTIVVRRLPATTAAAPPSTTAPPVTTTAPPPTTTTVPPATEAVMTASAAARPAAARRAALPPAVAWLAAVVAGGLVALAMRPRRPHDRE